MEFVKSQKVSELLITYPDPAKRKLEQLRALIIETAKEINEIKSLVETTKWGEPSYVTKTGSTIRMDWKKKTADKYYLYFICSTELVSTFRFMLGDELQFEGNRAIVFDLDRDLPIGSVKKCIQLALTYHKVKHLPMLGI